MERNRLVDIDGSFNLLSSLQVLILRGNEIERLTDATFMGMDNLISLDLSKNGIAGLEKGVFKNEYLNEINISSNRLQELEGGTFDGLSILEVLDLSHNEVATIANGAFDNVPRLKTLYLGHNRLSSYKSDYFANMGDGEDADLHTLDISHNELTYLYPKSFMYHASLRKVDFSHNKFSFFPTQFLKGLADLQELKLSHNLIKTLDDEDFANMLDIKNLDLSHNEIESVSETAFQNSSQLQFIDLSHNGIGELLSDTFQGSIRLNLDLSYNKIKSMPKGMFDKPKVLKLESVDLSHNKFDRVPVDVLQSQYFHLNTLRMAHNNIRDIPSDANVLVNIKEVDLSFNPLTEESIKNVLNEPKTARSLNMAGTGIREVRFFSNHHSSMFNFSIIIHFIKLLNINPLFNCSFRCPSSIRRSSCTSTCRTTRSPCSTTSSWRSPSRCRVWTCRTTRSPT